MGRRLNDWISSYLKFTENTESPKSYHIWAAVSCIAGALQRRTWFEWGPDTIYPNQYIILVGPSGESRKGVAISIARGLLSKVSVQLAGQSATKESLIQRMSENPQTFTHPVSGNQICHCSMTIVSEE